MSSYRLEVGPTPTAQTALVVTPDTAALVDADGQASSWPRPMVATLRLVVGQYRRRLHHVRLVGYGGETLASVPWESVRQGPLERLCREASLPLETCDDDDLQLAIIGPEQEILLPLMATPPDQTSAALILARRLVTVRTPDGGEHTWPRVGAGDPHEPQVARIRKYCRPWPADNDDLYIDGPGDVLLGLVSRGLVHTMVAIATKDRMPPEPPGELVEGMALLDPDNRMLCLIQARGYTSDQIDYACSSVAIASESTTRTTHLTETDTTHGAIFIPQALPARIGGLEDQQT